MFQTHQFFFFFFLGGGGGGGAPPADPYPQINDDLAGVQNYNKDVFCHAIYL